jgi:hypothetical protein
LPRGANSPDQFLTPSSAVRPQKSTFCKVNEPEVCRAQTFTIPRALFDSQQNPQPEMNIKEVDQLHEIKDRTPQLDQDNED